MNAVLIEPRVVPPLAGSTKEALGRWVARARSLGYGGMIIDIAGHERAPGVFSVLRDVHVEVPSFSLLTRTTLQLDDRGSVKARLAGIRHRSGVDVICVRSTNTEVLNFLAKDGRVDVIRLESLAELDAFNDGVASLAGQNGVFIELPFTPLVRTRGAARSKFIRACNKVLETCGAYRARLLFSSDADRLVDVKNAWQKAIVLQILLDASKQVGREIAIKHPAALVERCKRKADELAAAGPGITEEEAP